MWLRPVRIEHTAYAFGRLGGVFIGIGKDGRPSSVMILHGLSARAALYVLRLLAEGSAARPDSVPSDPADPEPDFLPLDASPALWGWLCSAFGDACARLPLLPDEGNLLPTAAA